MTGILENPATTLSRQMITCSGRGSVNFADRLAKLTTLSTAECERLGRLLKAAQGELSEAPLELTGQFGERKLELVRWLRPALGKADAEMVAGKLHRKVNYLHWQPIRGGGHALIIEFEPPKSYLK